MPGTLAADRGVEPTFDPRLRPSLDSATSGTKLNTFTSTILRLRSEVLWSSPRLLTNMRVNALKIALFAAFSLLASAAHAHTHGHRHVRHPLQRSQATNPAKSVSILHDIRRGRRRRRLLPIEAQSLSPIIVPALSTRGGRFFLPGALRGSREILLRQNEMADKDGLDRIQDDEDLTRMRRSRLLVALPTNAGLQTDNRLPVDRRYCRPWTAQFLLALGRAHLTTFHSSLQINSAVRTVAFQRKLLRTNGNAAPALGNMASPHLTGQAVDLAKHGLTVNEIAWLRAYLLPLVQEGRIDVEEEFQQACFHVSVYRKYLPPAPIERNLVHVRHASEISLAMR